MDMTNKKGGRAKTQATVSAVPAADPQITVGIPTRGNAEILWLQLESLLRQRGDVTLEIIVNECPSDNEASATIEEYSAKFTEAGHRFVYLRNEINTPLLRKWRIMANAATTPYFIMVGSDDYSPSMMAALYLEAFDKGAQWIDSRSGVFYDFATKQMGLWSKPYPRSGLQCATTTEAMRSLPDEDVRKGVDGFILGVVNPVNKVEVDFADGCHTDGYNGITTHRAAMYNTGVCRRPFSEFTGKLTDIVPSDVATRMAKM